MKIKFTPEISKFLTENGDFVHDGVNSYYRFPINWIKETDDPLIFETELSESEIEKVKSIMV